jgi:hypothetical protein
MTNKELDEIKQLIARDKHEVKQLNAWRNKLLIVENDESEHMLDRFKAWKERTYCDKMAASIDAQLLAYANIVNNMKKSMKA